MPRRRQGIEPTAMKKSEAEALVRSLCHAWKERIHPDVPDSDVSVNVEDFSSWLRQEHPQVFSFRSVVSPLDEVERWARDELHQQWRY